MAQRAQPEIEDPPQSSKSGVWDHFGFPVRYDENGARIVDKTATNMSQVLHNYKLRLHVGTSTCRHFDNWLQWVEMAGGPHFSIDTATSNWWHVASTTRRLFDSIDFTFEVVKCCTDRLFEVIRIHLRKLIIHYPTALIILIQCIHPHHHIFHYVKLWFFIFSCIHRNALI